MRRPGAGRSANLRHPAEESVKKPAHRPGKRKESGPFGPTQPPPAAEIGAVVYWAPDSCSCSAPTEAVPTSGNRVAPGFVVPDPVTRPPGRQDAPAACSVEPGETA